MIWAKDWGFKGWTRKFPKKTDEAATSMKAHKSANVNLGIASKIQGDLKGAATHFAAALRLDPASDFLKKDLTDVLQLIKAR